MECVNDVVGLRINTQREIVLIGQFSNEFQKNFQRIFTELSKSCQGIFKIREKIGKELSKICQGIFKKLSKNSQIIAK